MKTADLIGAQLDAAVLPALRDPEWQCYAFNGSGAFSSDWASGGPIIERNLIAIEWKVDVVGKAVTWAAAMMRNDSTRLTATGPTPLIAAMRAFVASKFGEEVPDA